MWFSLEDALWSTLQLVRFAACAPLKRAKDSHHTVVSFYASALLR